MISTRKPSWFGIATAVISFSILQTRETQASKLFVSPFLLSMVYVRGFLPCSPLFSLRPFFLRGFLARRLVNTHSGRVRYSCRTGVHDRSTVEVALRGADEEPVIGQ